MTICFNYGCLTEELVSFSHEQMDSLAYLFSSVNNPLDERVVISAAVGRMLGWAGEQTAISADRGGNYADNGVYGKMDCIDHSITTSHLLQLMEQQGWLQFHRVLDRAKRSRLKIFEHYSAQIEEIPEDPALIKRTQRFAVDSWFYDNGHPAPIIPLYRWIAGGGPK